MLKLSHGGKAFRNYEIKVRARRGLRARCASAGTSAQWRQALASASGAT
jgi:hypothetical protein